MYTLYVVCISCFVRTKHGNGQNNAGKYRENQANIPEMRHLKHFDRPLPIQLACDPSPYGVGAVITMDGSRNPVLNRPQG
jgi:hypothetical protein